MAGRIGIIVDQNRVVKGLQDKVNIYVFSTVLLFW